MTDPTPDDMVAAAVQALVERGSLPEAELLRRLGPKVRGPEAADGLVDALLDEPGVYELPDNRWVWLPTVLDGRVFTHRVGELELAHDVLVVDADLLTPLMLTELPQYARLTDGSTVQDLSPTFDAELLAERGVPVGEWDVEGVLLLEPGRLSALGVSAGDLVALTVTPGGFDLSVPGELEPSDIGELVAALAAQDPQAALDLFDVMVQLCVERPDSQRNPTAPLCEVLRAAGLDHDAAAVAVDGFDFDDARAQGHLQAEYDLDEDEATAVAVVLELCADVGRLLERAVDGEDVGNGGDGWPTPEHADRPVDDDERQVAEATLEYLRVPAVADAVCQELDPSDRRAATALGVFAESAEASAPRSLQAPLRYLQGVAQERLGDTVDAEQTFGVAESLDPSWPLTLIRLAEYAADRGQADRGIGLLQRAGVEADDPLVQLLLHFQPAPRTDLGRNQPCWCGSGRKYKACHLHREQLALSDRAPWLYAKASSRLGEWATAEMVEAAEVRAGGQGGDDALAEALTDPFVADAVLFEGGVFYRFLARRGDLLPDDEHEMARQWLDVDRSVHEVVSVDGEYTARMKDLQTGDEHDVIGLPVDGPVEVGALYCARVVPAGDTWQMPGGLVPVVPEDRDELLALLADEPSATDVVRFLTRAAAEEPS